MSSNEDNMSPETALDLITRVFLQEWTTTSPKDVSVKKITGGFSNTTWLVSRNQGSKEPSQVIIRQSRGLVREVIQGFSPTNEVQETLIYNEVSKYGCGPKLFAVFDDFKVIEFIDSETLTPQLASDPIIMKEVAKSMARYHSMDLPIDRRGFGILKKTEELIEKVPELYDFWNQAKNSVKDKIRDMKEVEDFLKWDIIKELHTLQEIGVKVNSRVVLIHGDPNFSNRLVRKTAQLPDQLMVLSCDFEFSCYSERAFDIGGHFCNFMFEFSKPGHLSGHAMPDEDDRKLFLKEYLQETKKLKYLRDFDELGRDSLDNIMYEADYGILVYLLFLIGWLRHTFKTYFKDHPSFCDIFSFMINKYEEFKQKFQQKYA